MSNLSYPEICLEFRRMFGTSFQPFFDPVLSVATGRIYFDLVRFDDYLLGTHSDYVDGISMRRIIRMKYGQEAETFIESLIS